MAGIMPMLLPEVLSWTLGPMHWRTVPRMPLNRTRLQNGSMQPSSSKLGQRLQTCGCPRGCWRRLCGCKPLESRAPAAGADGTPSDVFRGKTHSEGRLRRQPSCASRWKSGTVLDSYTQLGGGRARGGGPLWLWRAHKEGGQGHPLARVTILRRRGASQLRSCDVLEI
jgi:hypothetical protein